MTNSKTKSFTIKLSAWAVMALIAFGALFSQDGMGLAFYPNDIGVHTTIANILSNFVTLLNVVVIILTAIILGLLIFADDFIAKTVDGLVEEQGVEKTVHALRFRKASFLFVTIPFWTLLVASGWIFTMLVWGSLSAVMHTMLASQRKYLRENYIKDVGTKDEKPSAHNELVDNDLV